MTDTVIAIGINLIFSHLIKYLAIFSRIFSNSSKGIMNKLK